MGYAYTCPDMIGGGSFADFLPNSTTFEPEILIRYCQIAAMMPMMQFSVAPWRMLSKEHYQIILDMYKLHVKFAPKFIALAKEASKTGEPIVRALEYVFPNEGYGRTFDAFMLGDDILVAPVTGKDEYTRTIRLPKGTWEDELGVVYEGGQEITVDAPIERLPYFIKK
jgi:alpha-glucosidase